MSKSDKKKTKSFAERLKQLRDSLGMTQRQFAKEFGVSQATIANWEVGERNPTGTAVKLLEVYEKKSR